MVDLYTSKYGSVAYVEASFHNCVHNPALVGHHVSKVVNSIKESSVAREKQQKLHFRCNSIQHVFKVQ